MKQYKLGNALCEELSSGGRFVCNFKNTVEAYIYEDQLLEMGAQLVEEEKPQEIEQLPELELDRPTLENIEIRAMENRMKINEVIKALNTHLSACGKEKQC